MTTHAHAISLPLPVIAHATPVSPDSVTHLFFEWLPFVLIVAFIVAGVRLTSFFLLRQRKLSLDARLPRQITIYVLTFLGIVVVILALPERESGGISDQTRGDLLSLVGLGVTALITLSSTTLAANAMAGLMLRATAPFRGGDWVRVGEYFGRVTERGLFHTEIQTEDRDLISLPNLYLATNPVRIVQEKGTVVSAEISLGYDNFHSRVEELLIEAAEQVGLTDPFVWIVDLKDHAVVYRIAGTLTDVKGLISVRSRLRARMLDTLHNANIEIASPSLTIQRRGTLADVALPPTIAPPKPEEDDAPIVEERIFDKAEVAAKVGELDAEKHQLHTKLEEIKGLRKAAADDTERSLLDDESQRIHKRLEEIKQEQEAAVETQEEHDSAPADPREPSGMDDKPNT